jgi:hypothetical protein
MQTIFTVLHFKAFYFTLRIHPKFTSVNWLRNKIRWKHGSQGWITVSVWGLYIKTDTIGHRNATAFQNLNFTYNYCWIVCYFQFQIPKFVESKCTWWVNIVSSLVAPHHYKFIIDNSH